MHSLLRDGPVLITHVGRPWANFRGLEDPFPPLFTDPRAVCGNRTAASFKRRYALCMYRNDYVPSILGCSCTRNYSLALFDGRSYQTKVLPLPVHQRAFGFLLHEYEIGYLILYSAVVSQKLLYSLYNTNDEWKKNFSAVLLLPPWVNTTLLLRRLFLRKNNKKKIW